MANNMPYYYGAYGINNQQTPNPTTGVAPWGPQQVAPQNYYTSGYQPQPMNQQPPGMVQPQAGGNAMDFESPSSMAWVQGESGAKGYPIAKGACVVLFDSESPDTFWVKSTDGISGRPRPMHKYHYTEVFDAPNNVSGQAQDMVSKKEFDDMKTRMNAIDEKLSKLLEDLSN